MLNGHMLTGELLDIDTALAELFDFMVNDTTSEVRYIKPSDTDDQYRTLWYDSDYDNFVDLMGYPVFRDSWAQDHGEWVICVLD